MALSSKKSIENKEDSESSYYIEEEEIDKAKLLFEVQFYQQILLVKKDSLKTSASLKEKVEFYREFSKVKNTVNVTNNWMEVENEQVLIKQLCFYFANMSKKDGSDYSVNSVRASFAAIICFLQDNSKIKSIDLYNNVHFKEIRKVVDGKIRYLFNNGKGKIKGSDSLEADEITQILNHRLLDSSMPERLLRRVFFINVIYLGLRGEEHTLLNATDFVKSEDDDITLFIDQYLSLRSRCAEPDFYLQEIEKQFVNEKSAEILNSQISCMNKNKKRIMDKEDNNFKTAKEDKEY
ncbi:hypothetical protein RhiirA5_432034 [Rhizophagus irregularis]|uniref:Uncharacterized protein n=1 Tax=Rhizophagus irregularis TaxID=588596 RepID=A0A2N0NU22_9GLOM|nr:hypothetical protein RhiirA5_432034 [Rhizophagus irregularis]